MPIDVASLLTGPGSLSNSVDQYMSPGGGGSITSKDGGDPTMSFTNGGFAAAMPESKTPKLPNVSGLLSNISVPGAGAAVGAAQILAGIIQNRMAKSMVPSYTDPAQVAFLADLNMKRKNMGYAGTDYGQGVNLVGENLSRVLDSISKIQTGNTGSVVSGMAIAGAGANSGVNSIVANANPAAYDNLALGLTNDIAKRKFDIQMYQMLQKKAQATQNISSGIDNAFSGFKLNNDPSVPNGAIS